MFEEQKCIIQKYKCKKKKCGKKFLYNIKSIVDENCNITKPVIEYNSTKYTLFLEIAFIKFSICSKRFFNVDISHQSIESCIIIWMKNDDISVNESYSRHYLFDSLFGLKLTWCLETTF